MEKSMKRREFLRLSAVGAAGALLAACAPATPEVVTVKETVVVKEEVPVAQTVAVQETVVVTAVPEPGQPVKFELWAQD
jgi:uncharacterized lipoprotein YajG